eukprot:1658532-Rhodomonas_salina.1
MSSKTMATMETETTEKSKTHHPLVQNDQNQRVYRLKHNSKKKKAVIIRSSEYHRLSPPSVCSTAPPGEICA